MKKAVRILFTLIFILCAASLTAEDITLESDVLKLVLHEQSGSFSLYRRMGPKNRLTALNEFTGSAPATYFAVKAGNSFVQLRRSYDMTVHTVRNSADSASIIWDLGNLQAEVRFTLLATEKDKPADAVRVDMYVMNLSDKEAECSMKAVIDTVLGETSRIHFTTARGTAIRSEKGWTSMVQDKWLSSSDGSGTVSFLFAGSAATAPEYVLAASRDLLLSDTWKPVVNEGRGFSTLQSPNNSAIGIWYKDTKLKLFETACYTFFMTTAADGNAPLNGVLLGLEAEPAAAAISEGVSASATQIVDAAVEGEAYVTPVVQESTVDYGYIQQLLERIRVIEESDNPDPEEIERLSAEIDAVILELTK